MGVCVCGGGSLPLVFVRLKRVSHTFQALERRRGRRGEERKRGGQHIEYYACREEGNILSTMHVERRATC